VWWFDRVISDRMLNSLFRPTSSSLSTWQSHIVFQTLQKSKQNKNFEFGKLVFAKSQNVPTYITSMYMSSQRTRAKSAQNTRGTAIDDSIDAINESRSCAELSYPRSVDLQSFSNEVVMIINEVNIDRHRGCTLM
jgi:hypothetical protein